MIQSVEPKRLVPSGTVAGIEPLPFRLIERQPFPAEEERGASMSDTGEKETREAHGSAGSWG